jgi:sugar phosphate isomerase/epimerase
MKLGIFAKTFPDTTPLCVLSAARDAGYSAVQYNMTCSGLAALPLEISGDVATAVAAASDETGVEVAAVSATYNMIHPDAAVRENGRRGFQAIASVARRMGTRLLTVCSGTRDPADQWHHHSDNANPAAWLEMCTECSRLLAIAETYDLEIGVEPELNNVVSSAERARQLIDTLGSDRIRIVFDPANLVEIASPERRRRIIESAVDLLRDRIALGHAKDRRPDGRFAAAGQGVIDFAHYLTVLRRAGFSGALITHGLAAGEASQVRRLPQIAALAEGSV